MARKFKRSVRNPKLPGPDYYEGCFKKGKTKKLVEAEEEEKVTIESQEGAMM